MGPEGVDQIAPLADMFAKIYEQACPKSLLILGCATGNGLQCVDPSITARTVGIDIQPQYLAIARSRYSHLGKGLQLIRGAAEDCFFQPSSFDLVHGGLFFEYVNPPSMLSKIATWLTPTGVCSAIVQLPSRTQAPVSPSRFESIGRIKDVMRLIDPSQMVGFAQGAGLSLVREWEVTLASGKAFQGLIFHKAG